MKHNVSKNCRKLHDMEFYDQKFGIHETVKKWAFCKE